MDHYPKTPTTGRKAIVKDSPNTPRITADNPLFKLNFTEICNHLLKLEGNDNQKLQLFQDWLFDNPVQNALIHRKALNSFLHHLPEANKTLVSDIVDLVRKYSAEDLISHYKLDVKSNFKNFTKNLYNAIEIDAANNKLIGANLISTILNSWIKNHDVTNTVSFDDLNQTIAKLITPTGEIKMVEKICDQVAEKYAEKLYEHDRYDLLKNHPEYLCFLNDKQHGHALRNEALSYEVDTFLEIISNYKRVGANCIEAFNSNSSILNCIEDSYGERCGGDDRKTLLKDSKASLKAMDKRFSSGTGPTPDVATTAAHATHMHETTTKLPHINK